MTRYLSRVFDDPECGSYNEETELLFAYHQATKHTYDSVRSSAHYLDWKNQPNSFRTYEGAPTIALPHPTDFPNIGTFAAIAALVEETKITNAVNGSSDPLPNLALVSRLLWYSMAIS